MVGLRIRGAALTASALLVAGLAGCGSEDDADRTTSTAAARPVTGPAVPVARAYERFFAAVTHGDGTRACALLTPEARDDLVTAALDGTDPATRGKVCERLSTVAGKAVTDRLGNGVRAEVVDVEIDGRTATGQVVLTADEDNGGMTLRNQRRTSFERIDGAWRVGDPG